MNTLIQMDGDEHRAHRQLVNDWFKPGEIKKLSDQVALQAKRSIDEMAAKGGVDFATDVAMNYPLRVILDIPPGGPVPEDAAADPELLVTAT